MENRSERIKSEYEVAILIVKVGDGGSLDNRSGCGNGEDQQEVELEIKPCGELKRGQYQE